MEVSRVVKAGLERRSGVFSHSDSVEECAVRHDELEVNTCVIAFIVCVSVTRRVEVK